MPIDPSIPLQARGFQLESPMAQAGNVLGILNAIGQQRAQQIQLQKLQRQEAEQVEFRNALAQLGENPDQNALARLASQYASPNTVLQTQQSSADRVAQRQQRQWEFQQQAQNRMDQIEAQAREGRITREEADRRNADLRRELQASQFAQQRSMANIAASLRQPPQPTPPIAIPDATSPTGFKYVTREQALGQPAPAPASAKDKPLTEFQGKAVLYGTRAAQSDKILKTLEDKISLPGLEAGRALGRPGNYLLSSEQQRVDQAQRDFVNAVLRQESGAVISDAEFANAQKQYFPQPGDTPATLTQKRKNREIAIKGFSTMAGPGASSVDEVRTSPLLPGGQSGATGEWSIKTLP